MNSSNGLHKVTRLFSIWNGPIISSIVLDHLHRRFGNDPAIGIAYLYCNFRQQHEQKCSDLIVSLLKQLAQERPSIPDVVKNLYIHHKPKQTRPLPDEVLCYWSLFDALDESQVSYEGRGKFLQEIFLVCVCFTIGRAERNCLFIIKYKKGYKMYYT